VNTENFVLAEGKPLTPDDWAWTLLRLNPHYRQAWTGPGRAEDGPHGKRQIVSDLPITAESGVTSTRAYGAEDFGIVVWLDPSHDTLPRLRDGDSWFVPWQQTYGVSSNIPAAKIDMLSASVRPSTRRRTISMLSSLSSGAASPAGHVDSFSPAAHAQRQAETVLAGVTNSPNSSPMQQEIDGQLMSIINRARECLSPTLLRLPAVCNKLGCGKSTAWKYVSHGLLPSPIYMGRSAAWFEGEINAVIAVRQLAARSGFEIDMKSFISMLTATAIKQLTR
jgi:predicted DNA-binding transcriptional regulator AlpA